MHVGGNILFYEVLSHRMPRSLAYPHKKVKLLARDSCCAFETGTLNTGDDQGEGARG